LDFIEKAGAEEVQGQSPSVDKERGKQYIGKLIEYIGNCGKHYGKSGTVKYLLMSFIGVLDMAGQGEETVKGKHKAKKRTLVSHNN
jgi:hypothetical protein